VWEVLAEFQRNLDNLGRMTWLDIISQTRLYLEQQGDILPYRAVVVDETQDLHPEELRLLRQIVPEGPNDMFLVGDAHQRIYGRPVVLSHCGINVRGRSSKLRINYRTTEEIRDRAVSVLTDQSIDDLDGGLDDHLGYRSLLHGAPPSICHFESQTDEQAYMIGALESLIIGDNVPAETICVVARTSSLLENYRAAFEASGIDCLHLQADTRDDAGPGVRLATIHRVKDLELAHALIVGVNEDVIPSPHVSEDRMVQEQCLLHVAASRARDTATVAG
jgi:superfamily I DNA/RNA helicase